MTLGWGLEWGNLNFALGTNHFVWDRGQWAKQWSTFWCLYWSKRGDLVRMATRRKKLGGVSLNLDPKSQLTSVSSINDQDADTLMALRGLDGKLSIADVVSKTNLTEEKIVSLAKKGILMAQFRKQNQSTILAKQWWSCQGRWKPWWGGCKVWSRNRGFFKIKSLAWGRLTVHLQWWWMALSAGRNKCWIFCSSKQRRAVKRCRESGSNCWSNPNWFSSKPQIGRRLIGRSLWLVSRGERRYWLKVRVSLTPYWCVGTPAMWVLLQLYSLVRHLLFHRRVHQCWHIFRHIICVDLKSFSQDQVSHQSCLLTVRERMILWMRKVIPGHGTWSRKRWNHRGNIRVSWFMIHHRKKACERHILPGDLGCLIRRFDSGRCWKMAVAGGWIIFQSTQTGHLKLRRRRDKATKSLAGRDIGHHLLRRIAGRIRGHRLPSRVRDAGVIVIGHRHQSRQTSQVIGMTKGVGTNTSRTGVGSQVALVTQAHIVLDGTNLRRAVDIIRILSVMCPLVSRLIVSQLNQGTNTHAVDGCRHFLNFRPLTVKQLSGVGSFSNSASWQNQVVGQNVRNGIDCWDVCEERLLPTCRVGQSQSERTTMPWKSSWINAMESWSCRLQPDSICSPWGKKRLKAWMTSLTRC